MTRANPPRRQAGPAAAGWDRAGGARRPAVRPALLRSTALVGSLAALCLAGAPARANPAGGTVSAGAAVIQQAGPNTLDIVQSSNSAIINWQSFNIAPQETTNFQQPSASAVTLNRIGGSESFIDGGLHANGSVFLINPNGVIFGPNAQVNVNGLVATTANISDQGFEAGVKNGRYHFNQPSTNPNATVQNQGQITVADGGLVALVAPGVGNSGTINARLGRIALGGAKTFGLDLYGDGLLYFDTGAKVTEAPTVNGKPVSSLVSNSGTIEADGGSVSLTATAASQVVDQVINTSGVIEARAVAVNGGTILLSGSGGAVVASGTLDASGAAAGQTGGTVKLLGDTVALLPGGAINVSGAAGGGTVLLGGDLHGQGPDPDANVTYVAPGATIDADALSNGNGGDVVLWSQEATGFFGSISAKGGAGGGGGGTVEVSSKGFLDYAGTANLTAPAGVTGTLLLDPPSIDIENNPGNTFGTSFSSGTDTYSPNGSADPAILDTGVLENQLALSSVQVATSGNTAGTGDINVLSPVSWSNPNELALFASGSINVNASITATGASSAGVLILFATGGAVNVTAPISVGAVTAFAGTVISLGANVTTNNGPGQEYEQSVILGTNVTLTDTSAAGIEFDGTVDATAPGAQSLTVSSPAGTSFFGPVGSNVPLGALTVTGPTTIDAGITIATAGGAITFNGPVTLLEPDEDPTTTILTDGNNVLTGANINFNGTIDGDFPGFEALTLDAGTAGIITLGGNVGATVPLGALTMTDAQLHIGPNVNITTANAGSGASVSQQGATILEGIDGSTPTLTTIGTTAGNTAPAGSIVFTGTVDGQFAGEQGLTLNAGSGAVGLDGSVGSAIPLQTLAVIGASITLGGPVTATTLDLDDTGGGGTVTQSGPLTVANLDLVGPGVNFTLNDTTNSVGTVAANAGNVILGDSISLTVGAVNGTVGMTVSGNIASTAALLDTGSAAGITFAGNVSSSGFIEATTASGNITIDPGVTLTAQSSGSAIVLSAGSGSPAGTAAGGDFINDGGAAALFAPNGNWSVYTGDLVGSGTVADGLTFITRYDTGSGFTPAPGGNYFLFRDAPVLTVTATSQTISVGSPLPSLGFTVTGEVNGDSPAAAFTGTPTLSTTGTPTSLPGNYPISIAAGSATSPLNYQLVFDPGTLQIGTTNLTNTPIGQPIPNVTQPPVPQNFGPGQPLPSGVPLDDPAAVAGALFDVPFLDKNLISEEQNPDDPTLSFSNSGDRDLW